MSLPVVVSDQASEDIVEHVQFLGRARPELGRRFLVAVKRTIEIIAEFPGGGSFFELENPQMPAMRKWPIRGFRGFLVFYRDEGTSVAILRVVHGSRDLPKLFGDGVSDR